MHSFTSIITSQDPAIRHQSLDTLCQGRTLEELCQEADELDRFRRISDNLYERVRALLFLYALHRFHIPHRLRARRATASGLIPFAGYEQVLRRRFEESIDTFLQKQRAFGPSDGVSSALASAYHRLAFQTLADQVRRSVRQVRGNQWMFRMGHPLDQPLRIRPELLLRAEDGTFPILREQTPVRMDLTHCGWSDIFFLGMDYPEGAKVLNVSVDLALHGTSDGPRPPVSAWLRVIDEPVLRLASVDLGAMADLDSLADVFDFAKDHLGLLKAAVIASGLVPPGIEGSGVSLHDLLARMLGPGRGLEVVSCVNDIPKGSRLAVSTNLLGSLISVLMRATGQATPLTGPLGESDRRLVLARALLGEWLGGSGGGWQDSGGIWPGIKLIEGVAATEGDPEWGISRGRLMPQHHLYSTEEIPASARKALQDSLVLVHGGMAQNVGPILEMVTEKYLLRSAAEWESRQHMLEILREILPALRRGDIRSVGAATTRNFQQLIQTIIPWATNLFTETLIARARAAFGADFWGFWMLGGMSGGGMGFIFAPERKAEAQARMQEIMSRAKAELEHALPFAMEPVVFDYAINDRGTWADMLQDNSALMPPGYYTITVPRLLRQDRHLLPTTRRTELDKFALAARTRPELRGLVQSLFDVLLPRSTRELTEGATLPALLEQNGFDRAQHEQIRADLKEGRIGLSQNRLRTDAVIEDAQDDDVLDLSRSSPFTTSGVTTSQEEGRPGADLQMEDWRRRGMAALRAGEVAVVSLAAGAGTRWTQGAGVCKALSPFARLGGKHRTFVETHLAKTRQAARRAGVPIPHIFTSSYLTHGPTAAHLASLKLLAEDGPVLLSPGRSVGLRFIPTARDLRFLWEEMPQQLLDEQQQKMRDSLRGALIHWAQSMGEATDYTDNLPSQCLHPVGHFFEIPNLLRNGVLAHLLTERPQLRWLLLHNIDTLGAAPDPLFLGAHIANQACLSFEVMARRLEDRGGGLARVNGRVRLVEGLAMPHEEDEFRLRFYNSMTTWIDLDRLLEAFGLDRQIILTAANPAPSAAAAAATVAKAIRSLAGRLPTYVTLKEVKKRWGHGQEDVFPVAQFEKLWGDLTALPEIRSQFLVVPRDRGQQLKDQAQLDGWLRDGSAAYVESLCQWE